MAVLSDEATRSRSWMSIAVLGVVFGDIGTSPLYAFRIAMTAAGGQAAPDALMGVASLIFWAITLVVTIKYVFVILKVDNKGEGGVLALAALLNLHRQHESKLKAALLVIAIAGAALLFGDAVITPAISVLSAMEGIATWSPGHDQFVLPAAVAVLIILFLLQRVGTQRIGTAFGPIMLVWFAAIGIAGLIAIRQAPEVLAALSPTYALAFGFDNPLLLMAVLGAAFLAVTGGEALYADLGQFGRKAIARAWLFVAMPALVLNYLGQAALALRLGTVPDNPFYSLFPSWLLVPMILLAAGATIIASQAVITGIFSLAKQAMELGILPPMRVMHTAAENEAHVFIPWINWLLAILCIAVAVAFGSSDALSSAYGIAVAGAMVTTTVLFVAVRLLILVPVDSLRPRWFLLAFAPIALLDLIFVAANLTKLFSGALVPVMLAGMVMLISYSWRIGRTRMVRAQAGQAAELRDLMRKRDGKPTTRKTGVFLARPGVAIPLTLAELTQLADVRFARTVIVTVWISSAPRVPMAQRVSISRFHDENLRIDVRLGYLQRINLPSLLGPAFDEHGIDADEVTYVAGLERPKAPPRIENAEDVLLGLFVVLSKLALRTSDRFQLPPTRTLEIGIPRQL